MLNITAVNIGKNCTYSSRLLVSSYLSLFCDGNTKLYSNNKCFCKCIPVFIKALVVASNKHIKKHLKYRFTSRALQLSVN